MMGGDPAGLLRCPLWERNAMSSQCEKWECPGCGWNQDEYKRRMEQIAGGKGLSEKNGLRYLSIRRNQREIPCTPNESPVPSAAVPG